MIVGYKRMRFLDHKNWISPVHPTVWSGNPLQIKAECHRTYSGLKNNHDAPQEDCDCGIYALKDFNNPQLHAYDGITVAVGMGGSRIIEGDQGYRAAEAVILGYFQESCSHPAHPYVAQYINRKGNLLCELCVQCVSNGSKDYQLLSELLKEYSMDCVVHDNTLEEIEFRKQSWAVGVRLSSEVATILGMDFDDVPLEAVKISLLEIMAQYALPFCDLYQSRADGMGWHVYFPILMPKWIAEDIICHTKYIDPKFVKHYIHYQDIVLRIGAKNGYYPQFVMRLDNVVSYSIFHPWQQYYHNIEEKYLISPKTDSFVYPLEVLYYQYQWKGENQNELKYLDSLRHPICQLPCFSVASRRYMKNQQDIKNWIDWLILLQSIRL